MELATPIALAGAAILVPLAWLLTRRRPGIAVPTVAGLVSVRPSWRVRARRALPLLRLAVVALLIAALARPRVGEATTVIPAEGIDIVLSIDLSSSMTTGQFGESGVSRLEGAREVVREFMQSRTDDRIGLVVFQQDAIPLAPLTLDYQALDTIVAGLRSGILPDGTAIGLGLGAAVDLLVDSEAKSRIAILLTDGHHNNLESIDPLQAARVASALGVRVYTIGIASPTMPESASVDVDILTSMAGLTGGRYFSAGTLDDLAAVYDEIGQLERSAVERDSYTHYREYGPWVALAAVAVLAVDLFLRATALRSATA